MLELCGTLWSYWCSLAWYLVLGRPFETCPYFRDPRSRQARVQTYSLALNLLLWDQPHYRHKTYAHDLRANLRNVAVPGTGVPLSIFCYHKVGGYLLVFLLNPLVCFLGAVNVARKDCQAPWSWSVLSNAFRQHLLFPDDWFSYWRLNCVLASWYELATAAPGYALENKWLFLQKCMQLGVPCSPVMDIRGICVKHKNEEGGLGIHFYQSASAGGDWIIQQTLQNASNIQTLLPVGAPLSTFRVMTGSRAGLSLAETDGGNPSPTADPDEVFAFSCVFRAGRANSATDHNSVLFDVDVKNKRFGQGTSNMHWYQLGPTKVFTTSWLNNSKFTHHPDGNIPVTGRVLPDIDSMIQTCVDAHKTLFPDVPIAGWDLCVVQGEPRLCLLEANLMCNFFKGTFDKDKYFSFAEDYFHAVETRRKNLAAATKSE
uniref:Alpha-L-glutamate ligase-related protein ATP-grasp domain-containing protein n=1 Tax=Rhizochromulina marina TaxID=1034831 RepID=A0A6U0YKX4_9STRA|mmetsp:Transcript_17893/g.52264  ORF Transcript_17893/g.52264 Transcript_17893/m.52264 type:complete len:429 (+) Transcript_17893:160-1446(+)